MDHCAHQSLLIVLALNSPPHQQLLLIFLSAHTVLMFFAGARFPPPVLMTLRALQSAKEKLFEAGVLQGAAAGAASARLQQRPRGSVRKGDARAAVSEGTEKVGDAMEGDHSQFENAPGGASTRDRAQGANEVKGGGQEAAVMVEGVPSLAFVVETPVALLRGSGGGGGVAKFERALDAQVRQVR